MKIDIQNNKIVIYDDDKRLGAVGKSQLSFWNFKLDYSTNEYSSNLDRQLFLKIVKYFDKEEYLFELKEDAKVYSKELEVVTLKFNNIKQSANNFKDGKFDIAEFERFRKFVAEKITRPLKIHQLKAAYHLYLVCNGANFSVPGSGKTSVVLTVYEKLRLEGKVNTLFVVGPPSCFDPWKSEFIETLGRKPRHLILAGGNKRNRKNQYYKTSEHAAELYLTSFQSLLFDQNEVDYFLKQKHVKAFFVVDEVHYIKQINGNWAQSILKQSEKTEFRCVLTGTPMPKSYTDIFNLFDFLWPKQSPISHKDKTLIKHYEANGNRRFAKNLLKTNIGPLFYRVRKSDLNLKPQNFFEPEIIEMNKYERIIYDAIHNRIKEYSKKEYYKNIEFVSKLGHGRMMRLRQAISYPKLLISGIDNYDESLFEDLNDLKNIVNQYDRLEVPSKIDCLIRKVLQFHKIGLKVVIWSNFIGTIYLIEKHIKNEGLICKKIIGITPIEGNYKKEDETREKIINKFVDPSSGLNILIANPAACAESISLHKTCHNAIYYDLSYNCGQYLQSLDRIHRVGGSENIEANYFYLQYKNTIDADIKSNIDVKTQKMYDIIEEDYSIYSLDIPDLDGDTEAYKRLFTKTKQI